MPEREERRELRGALARGEGAAVLRLLGRGPWPEDCLQLAGDGLRVALGQHVAGAEALARECMARLRTREWDGDDDLADALVAQLGSGPVRLLRPLAWTWIRPSEPPEVVGIDSRTRSEPMSDNEKPSPTRRLRRGRSRNSL